MMTMMTTTAMMIIIVKALYAFSVKSTEMAVHLVKPGMLKITADWVGGTSYIVSLIHLWFSNAQKMAHGMHT